MIPADEEACVLMVKLYHALAQRLHSDLKAGQRSIGLLSIARSFVHSSGLVTSNIGEKKRQAIYALYVRRLQEALSAPRPGASVFAEVRAFLRDQGLFKDLGTALEVQNAFEQLGSLELPFTTQ